MILLVDDHPLFVEGFRAMLAASRPELEVAVAGTAEEALQRVAQDVPDLVFLDVFLPDRDGFRLLEEIKAQLPAVPVVLISGREYLAPSVRVRAALADGFVSKATPPDRFLELLEAAMQGRGAWDVGSSETALPELTRRQAEILAFLAAGHGNKEIRYRLGIAERTVRAHLTDLFQQLGVTGRMQAVIKARSLGLIE